MPAWETETLKTSVAAGLMARRRAAGHGTVVFTQRSVQDHEELWKALARRVTLPHFTVESSRGCTQSTSYRAGERAGPGRPGKLPKVARGSRPARENCTGSGV